MARTGALFHNALTRVRRNFIPAPVRGLLPTVVTVGASEWQKRRQVDRPRRSARRSELPPTFSPNSGYPRPAHRSVST
jgi:hypothetical protein